MKVRFNDYFDKLGVFFYDERILFGWEHNYGVRSYRFKVKVYPLTCHSVRDDEKDDYEVLDFIYTCDLKDFTISKNFKHSGGGTLVFLDWEKLTNLACKKDLQYTKNRLQRRLLRSIPEKVLFDNWSEKGVEFLEFTKDSAPSWGGPFEHDGKLGCGVKINHFPNRIKELEKIDLFTQYSYYQLPDSARKKLDYLINDKVKFPNGDYLLHSYNPKQKKSVFNALLSPKEKVDVALNYFRGYSSGEYLRDMLSYHLYLYGTDDCSYTKYLATQEEVDKELSYLRKMQPLDFTKDITDRKYYFTN